jgi:enoyl-CoA hydratase/carnithine racemase
MTITVERQAHVAIVRLNRPEKLNALSLAMYDALGEAFRELNEDEAIRAVMLTGTGDKAFCVGADLLESIPALASGRMDITAWDGAHLKSIPFYKPIVCAVRGLCLGGGFELMLGTDLRVVAEDAVFQFPEPMHGFVPAGGTLVRLVRQVSYVHAMELLLTGRRFSACDLLKRGVVNQIVPSADVERVALELAHHLATLSPTALQTIKEAVIELRDQPWAAAFRREAELGQRTFTSDDARRALASFAARKLASETDNHE